MEISCRIVEMSDSSDWFPVGLAFPYQGQTGILLAGSESIRKIPASSAEHLDDRHRWSDRIRWGRILRVQQSAESGSIDPRRIFAEYLAQGALPAREDTVDDVVKRGATMEEIASLREPVARTPTQALRALKRGNSRYFNGTASNLSMSPIERRAQIIAQTPFAIVVGCSDSRVPIEIVFDQGPGNLFIVRVAGNVMGQATLGSIEYGIVHLKAHLVVVLGHEGCGAVSAALLDEARRAAEPHHVRCLLDRIVPAVQNIPPIRDRAALLREAVMNNVRLQVHHLNQNPVVRDAVAREQISVVGAFYSITSGAVDFVESPEDLTLDPDVT